MKGLIDVIRRRDGMIVLNSNYASVLEDFCKSFRGFRSDGVYEVKPDELRGGYSVVVTDEDVKPVVDDNTSDGFHTFGELYRYRMLYNAAFFNELAKSGECRVVKSLRHGDGELCFGGGWFIVMAVLPTGQISNHYELKDWDFFHVPVAYKAPEWDGHTPKDAADRLEQFINNYGWYDEIGENFWRG